MAPHHAPYTRAALAALAATTALIAAGCAPHSTDSSSGSSTQASSAGGTESPAPDATSPPSGTSSPASPTADRPAVKGAEGSGHADGTRSPGAGRKPGGGTPWCGTESMKVTLRSLEAGAGQRYAALVLTNTSDTSCRTRGWPGLQLTRDDGGTIPTTTARDRSPASVPITMRPGDRAWSRLHWTVVPGTGDPSDGTCPEPGALRVIPPDERRALRTDWKLGTVCGGGEVRATALRPGSGPAH